MMLLDTHAWLWWVDSVPGLLSPTVIEQLESAQTRVGVASISCLEVALLVKKGRVELPCSLSRWFDLALRGSHHHRDRAFSRRHARHGRRDNPALPQPLVCTVIATPVPVVVPGSGKTLELKVGQTVEVSSGAVSEAPPRAKSAPKAGESEPHHASPENKAGQ